MPGIPVQDTRGRPEDSAVGVPDCLASGPSRPRLRLTPVTALATAPLLLAAVLVAASVAKWNARDSLVSATQLLRLPAVLNRPVRWLPPIELALAIALVVAPVSPAFIVVSAAVLALMLAYTAVVARGLTFDPRPSCGCFGAVGSPITGDTLARNVVLAPNKSAGSTTSMGRPWPRSAGRTPPLFCSAPTGCSQAARSSAKRTSPISPRPSSSSSAALPCRTRPRASRARSLRTPTRRSLHQRLREAQPTKISAVP